jgi:hypothetical protein
MLHVYERTIINKTCNITLKIFLLKLKSQKAIENRQVEYLPFLLVNASDLMVEIKQNLFICYSIFYLIMFSKASSTLLTRSISIINE